MEQTAARIPLDKIDLNVISLLSANCSWWTIVRRETKCL